MPHQINRRSRLGPLSDRIGFDSEARFSPVDGMQNLTSSCAWEARERALSLSGQGIQIIQWV